MGAGHDHEATGAGHAHDHEAAAGRGRLAIAFGITASVLVAELVGAWLTGSLALLTDAAHMVTDAVGLLVALTAATLVRRPPTARRTAGGRARSDSPAVTATPTASSQTPSAMPSQGAMTPITKAARTAAPRAAQAGTSRRR